MKGLEGIAARRLDILVSGAAFEIGIGMRIRHWVLFLLCFLSNGPSEATDLTVEGFQQWLASFRQTAIASGIEEQTYDSIARSLKPDFGLPDLETAPGRRSGPGQAEFIKTPEQYLGEKYMATLVGQGRKLFDVHRKTLESAEKTYGADPAILLALWGRETAFGTYNLPYNALQVLAVEAYAGRRKEDFQKQFLLAIKMVQEGVIAPEKMKSSWAGAMGLVQFLPSDYYDYAVDGDGDGKRDIWTSVPDALTSLANNLQHIGWQKSQPWGLEVAVPKSIDCSLAYMDVKKPVSEWVRLGVTPVAGGGFRADLLSQEASLLMPAGTFGPAFLTFQNFQVLRLYNTSDLYALFVGHLADRIRGGGEFARKWQPVVQVASTDVEDMQKRLITLGFYNDKVDGKAGGRTRSAVGLYEKRAGLPQTCWPTAGTIGHLKTHTAAATQ